MAISAEKACVTVSIENTGTGLQLWAVSITR